MATHKQAFIAVLMATTLLTGGAAWAASPQTPDQQKATSRQASADTDFGKVSADGLRAFQDIMLTRIAIFDGRIDSAKKFIEEADTALGKAKTDETVFTKAEADLKPPASTDAPVSKNVSGAAPADNKPADQTKKPIAWLPVDGEITIDEDYAASPAKQAAVSDANKSLKGGDRKGAIEKLKLAGVNVDVALAVVPLEQTITSVRQAADMINNGKYYQASQVLKLAQDSERFDAANISGTPPKSANTAASTQPTK
jgi:TolA-binding protein